MQSNNTDLSTSAFYEIFIETLIGPYDIYS